MVRERRLSCWYVLCVRAVCVCVCVSDGVVTCLPFCVCPERRMNNEKCVDFVVALLSSFVLLLQGTYSHVFRDDVVMGEGDLAGRELPSPYSNT